MAATPWETEMVPIDFSDLFLDRDEARNLFFGYRGSGQLSRAETLMSEPSLHPDEHSAPEEFAAAVATSSEARPPSLQPNNGSTSRWPHVPRSDVNYVDRIDQLRPLQPRLLGRGKKDAMATASKEIVTAAPGVLIQSSRRVVLDPKRHRSQNWSPEEKTRFLELKEAALTAVDGKGWDYISRGMMEYGFERTPKNCEDQWGTLLKSYRAIEEHESSTTSRNIKLPLELHEGIGRILVAKEAKRSGIAFPESRRDEDDDSYTKSGLLQPPHILSYAYAPPSTDPRIDAAVNSMFTTLLRSCITSKQKEVLTSAAPLVAKRIKVEVDTVLKIRGFVHDRPSSPDFVMECITRALESSLQPVVSALQACAQEEEEGRKKLKVIADKRRALNVKEKQIKRRLPGLIAQVRGVGSKQRGCREKKFALEGYQA